MKYFWILCLCFLVNLIFAINLGMLTKEDMFHFLVSFGLTIKEVIIALKESIVVL